MVPTNTLPLGNDRLHAGHQALIRKQPVPFAFERRPNLRRRRPRAGRIMRQHRPVTARACRTAGDRGTSPKQKNRSRHAKTSHRLDAYSWHRTRMTGT